MEKSLLTKNQQDVLGLIAKDEFITKQFFLTGGTALSEFYLRHRFSEDFDLFSQSEFDPKKVIISISAISKKLKPTKIEQQSLSKQETFFFHFTKKDIVRIDLAFFPFQPLGRFKKYKSLKIASLEDITINKIQAIVTRKRARDYIDLYLCLKKLEWTTKDIRKNYKLKFDIELPAEELATSFVNVEDAQDMPIFLGNLPWKEVKKFFLTLTEKLKKNILN